MKDINLSQEAQQKILDRQLSRSQKGARISRRKKEKRVARVEQKVEKLVSSKSTSRYADMLLLAFLYWGEGSKTGNSVVFTNSDTKMLRLFIYLFRSSFDLDEKKFRIIVHLHEYHDRQEILSYWSQQLNIPLSQFSKPYLKSNTSKNKKMNYKGTVSLRYSDIQIARELKALYNKFSDLRLDRAIG